MPRRNDIKKVMIIGSGPIVIGQACEFDYSGTQACKALRSLGYEIVLVNSNTPMGKMSREEDSYIRKAAITYKIPYITTPAAALATARGIAARRQEKARVKSLQNYHADIK